MMAAQKKLKMLMFLPRVCILLFIMIVSSTAFFVGYNTKLPTAGTSTTKTSKWTTITTLLNMATSSKDLKSGQTKRQYSRVASRLSKAAKEAARKAAAEKKLKKTDSSSSDNDNNNNNDSHDNNDDDYIHLASITSLSHAIDEELLRPRDGFKPPRETSSIRNILEHNDKTKDSKNPKKIQELYHVAVVFSKPLWSDQITVEYASRLTKLARTMKYENYHPALICLCSATEEAKKSTINEKDEIELYNDKRSLVDATSAGIIFFKHLCSINDIPLNGTDFCIVHHEEGNELSWSSSTLHDIVHAFEQRHYLENWLEASQTSESATDEYGMTRDEPRKKIHIHWTLFSTEYHLCNLNDIHQRSPRSSPLNTLLQDFDHAIQKYRGIVRTTWCFRYSTYPYLYSPNDLTVFLGKCYLEAQGLQPLLINLRGVAKQSEFFQRDNYRALVGTRRTLVSMMEEMNESFRNNRQNTNATISTPPHLKEELRKRNGISTISSEIGTYGDSISTDVALESALLSLGRCVDLVRPAGTLSDKSVSREDWKEAETHLEHFLDLIERACDPDMPLPASDWGKLSVDENVTNTNSHLEQELTFVLEDFD